MVMIKTVFLWSNILKKDLVVGLGEIGLPIYKLFSKSSITGGFDIDPKLIPFMNKKNQLLKLVINKTQNSSRK